MLHQLLQRNVVFTGRVFNVAQCQYRLPDGRVQSYDLVEHLPAITLVPVDAQGRVIFVRQYRIGAAADLLELPAGVLKVGEDPLEGAARELREETGMASAALTRLGGFYMSPGYSSEYMHVFLAEELQPDPLPMDDDEFLEITYLPSGEALRMARSGELLDGKSIVALMMAERHLG
jgi:ADP-ribose pyrophosphatase